MRISTEQKNLLKKEILALLPDALIYLFGSRVDDSKKGGDIDIMVLSDRRLTWKEKAVIKWSYFQKYGEQKIDIITFSFKDDSHFKQIVLEGGIRL
ncbi:MAG: nucleotidyltransferase domain-containing protein [Deltaproteobacteria bacterium]|nr:nucleotidyltransferase domain-containing protein [Deltaproteobacteria bacterium]